MSYALFLWPFLFKNTCSSPEGWLKTLLPSKAVLAYPGKAVLTFWTNASPNLLLQTLGLIAGMVLINACQYPHPVLVIL